MDYRFQRRLAAEILGVGESRIWISPDPELREEIEGAVTKADVRALIKRGVIKVIPEKGNAGHASKVRHMQRRKGRRRGMGRRKGVATARLDPKERWMHRIRKIRRYLRYLRDKQVIDRKTYRRLYMLAKGGTFRDLASLKRYMADRGLAPEEKIR
ncbi:50S ribosomal protein L19e [Aeropyrum pernix]|uniref:Large ribosomal subunit protein eL19 n=1 Tax=Aeropyrum pernix TaxID=56636 RepID=A0A401HB54_AERPX|nr:50S ribosomal protein L19e [Aeropyrum pernix]GBF09681.1 50S ribosomal protein L19e [Aeropyrum pernix]